MSGVALQSPTGMVSKTEVWCPMLYTCRAAPEGRIVGGAGDGLHLLMQSYTGERGPSSTWKTAPKRSGQWCWPEKVSSVWQ